MDAANIDLKGFTNDFYRNLTGAEFAPVLDTIRYALQEADTWVELTTLLIPGENDSDAELHALSEWIMAECGPNVPLHFTAFHPDFRMMSYARTPADTLLRARDIARKTGLHHVYVGNIHHKAAQSTYCPGCGALVIGRDWHILSDWHLDDHGACITCGTAIAGIFDGPPGTWGNKRQPVRILA
jgi:pyruvate formate lyase activating enzyme